MKLLETNQYSNNMTTRHQTALVALTVIVCSGALIGAYFFTCERAKAGIEQQKQLQVDLESATMAELISLPNIGQATAERIVADRQPNRNRKTH